MQINKYNNRIEVIKLKSSLDLPVEAQLVILKKIILNNLRSSFKFYEEIKNGSLIIEHEIKQNDNILIKIVNYNDKKLIEEIEFQLLKNVDGSISISTFKSMLNKFISGHIPVRKSNLGIHYIQIIQKDNILLDQIIIHDDELPKSFWTKILNKTYTMSNLLNQHGEESILFKNCIGGKIIPFNSGENSKLLMLDDNFHSILYFDGSFETGTGLPLNGYYGSAGISTGQFFYPTGIALGRSPDGLSYPVYITDNFNNRLVRVNYIIDPSSNGLGHFDDDTYTIIKKIYSPSDVAYFNSTNSDLDKVWLSQQGIEKSAVLSINNLGHTNDIFYGYKDDVTGIEYYFSTAQIKLNIYNQGFSALGFIDKSRNNLVTCLLDENGNANVVLGEHALVVIANQITHFPENEKINSISFLKTSEASSLWPYVWVTSPSYIHLLKMNNNGHLQYLASTSKPKNTDAGFTNLLNTVMTDNYFDILTIESWNFTYGLRKYFPYCDIYSDSLYAYCDKFFAFLKFEATFTNDCWLYITAQRKNKDNNWETVKIKKLNGSTVDTTFLIKWQLASWNQASSDLFINLQLDLPIEDYVLGSHVKFQLKIFPEYNYPNLSDPNHITKEYITNINKTCLPKPVGCPFIYVKNEQDDFEADNNVLHKMEFSEPGTDITDVYKLRVTPKIVNNSFDIYLVENENDSAYIDMVKVYAVDYPFNKKLGVPEDNKIVIYDSVQVLAADSVMHNNTNITNNVYFHNPSGTLTTGTVNDSMYAHFSNLTDKNKRLNFKNLNIKLKETRAVSINSSKTGPVINYPIAFITNLRNLENPVIAVKDTAGFLTAESIFSNTVSKMFARRELESTVILPLFADTDKVDHLDIKWQSNFRMKYLGIANLSYTGFTQTEVPMSKGSVITAINDTDITSLLNSDNGEYGEVNEGKLLKMTFDLTNVPAPGINDKREYIIEVNGYYYKGQSSLQSKTISNLPDKFYISQNYPNPFNPVTKINFELPKTSKVNLVIYDILGREVKRMVNNEIKETGRYTVEFDGKNYASGVYFYRIEAGNFVQSKKMVLLK